MKPFRMLIGDDAYGDIRCTENSLLLMLVEMKQSLGIKEPLRAERIINGVYSTNQFPIKQFEGADIRVTCDPEEVIYLGNSGNYDWIVSDMDYGDGRTEGGLAVFRGIKASPGIVRAVFTSGDDARKLTRLRDYAKSELGVDYFIAPTLSEIEAEKRMHKTEVLGRTIANHYKITGETK